MKENMLYSFLFNKSIQDKEDLYCKNCNKECYTCKKLQAITYMRVNKVLKILNLKKEDLRWIQA